MNSSLAEDRVLNKAIGEPNKRIGDNRLSLQRSLPNYYSNSRGKDMGASESKIAVETPKPDRSRQIRNDRISQLIDPRSPSTGIDRTPIQVGEAAARASVEVVCEGPVLTGDPRSPSPGISRTPMKDVMRATVHSFARRLGMLFLNEGGDRASPLPPMRFSKVQNLGLEEEGEMDVVEPLLPLRPAFDSEPPRPTLADQAGGGEAVPAHSSAYQAGGEDERREAAEVDQVLELEEATTDDDDLPLNKELSLSLLACHDSAVSSEVSDVPDDAPRPLSPLPDDALRPLSPLPDDAPRPLSPLPDDAPRPLSPLPDDAPRPLSPLPDDAPRPLSPLPDDAPRPLSPRPDDALRPLSPLPDDASRPLSPLPDDAPRPLSPLPDIDSRRELGSGASRSLTPDSVQLSSAEASPVTSGDPAEPPNDEADTPAKPEVEDSPRVEESPEPAAADPVASPNENVQAQASLGPVGVKLPSFNTKSPSQVVFKPQWLGVGFGVTGVRVRGVQGKAKGSSSPLAVRTGGRNAGNENRGQVAKPKQRERCAKALANEGRSPLQILKETNSPMEQTSQMKLRISTPDRQRLGQIDRRTLSLSLNKENQR